LQHVDFTIINNRDFKDSDDGRDRKRKYQAEFLVKDSLPISALEKIITYSDETTDRVEKLLSDNGYNSIPVKSNPKYYFD
jgi:hypothetical protein